MLSPHPNPLPEGERRGEGESSSCVRRITCSTPVSFRSYSIFQKRKTVQPCCLSHVVRRASYSVRLSCWPPASSITRQNLEYRVQRDAGGETCSWQNGDRAAGATGGAPAASGGGATAGRHLCCFPLTKCATLFAPRPISSPYLPAAFS